MLVGSSASVKTGNVIRLGLVVRRAGDNAKAINY